MFQAHYELVWRLVRRLGVAQDAADDAAQQVFLVAAERLDDIAVGSERAFLYGTALHVARSVRRKSGREPATDRGEELICAAPRPDELMERKRARETLDVVLETLSEDLRIVFVLHEFESLTMREIAEILALPPGTIASRLRRARENFQAELRETLARRDHPERRETPSRRQERT